MPRCLIRFLPVAVCVLLLLQPVAAGPLNDALPHVKGTRAIVLEQLEALIVAEPDLHFVGQGSWLHRDGAAPKGGGASRPYRDPLTGGSSDHDLRLIMIGEKDPQVAARWLRARSTLADNIRRLFPQGATAKTIEQTLLRYGFAAKDAAAISQRGAEQVAEAILKSVNLYTPPQLVKFVVDGKTAAATFGRLGAVPNLGGKVIEGVWGTGSTATAQGFESGGHLFAMVKGKVRLGFVDAAHIAEGYGRYGVRGAANMSLQWAEKAIEAMDSGDVELVAKYLKRLRDDLQFAARKGNLAPEALGPTLKQLEQFIGAAETGGSAIGPELRALLQRAQRQSSVLHEFARNPGVLDREILQAILEPGSVKTTRWAKLSQWFSDVWPSAETLAKFERVMQGLFLAFSTWQVSGTWGETGMEDALRLAGVEGAMLVSLPVGAVLMLTNAVIDNAKAFGYNSAVKAQEWREFLAGISSVTGYEGMTGLELSVEKLAVNSVSPAEVERAVELQAFNISRLKDTGAPDSDATTSAREEIKRRLIANMTPIVLAEWRRARKMMITQYLDLALELDWRMNDLVLSAASTPVPITVEKDEPVDGSVQLSTLDDLAPIQDLLARMEAAIRPLGGPFHIVVFRYRGSVVWEQDGRPREVSTTTRLQQLFETQTARFPGPGSYPMTARFTLEVSAPSLGGLDEAKDVFDAQGLLARTYRRTIPFEVEVVRTGTFVFREWWDAAKTIVKREYEYIIDAKGEHIRNGFERVFYENSQLSYEGRRKGNNMEGPMTRYWANGQTFDISIYKGNSREGAYTAFYSDGKPRAEGQFIGGRKVGRWKTYYANGNLESEGDYPAAFYLVEPLGPGVPMNTEADKGLYYNFGPKVGSWTLYYGSGKKQREEGFDEGNKYLRTFFDNEANSPEWEADASGTKRWHDNGQIQEQCPAKGKCRSWDRDGKEIIRLVARPVGGFVRVLSLRD